MHVMIMRGLPGSGKSTYAKSVPNAHIVSADLYFEQQGGYAFNPKQLHEAHIWCFREFLKLLQQRITPIIVDNTNITAVEIAPYALAAESYGYTAEIMQFSTDVQTAAQRNVHRVPKRKIMMMQKALESAKLPPWWKICHMKQ